MEKCFDGGNCGEGGHCDKCHLPEQASSGNSELLPAVPYDQYEQEILELIKERDYWCDKATELANDIGEALGFEVGEHTSANCPVQSAIDGVLEMSVQIEEWKGR